VPATRHSNCATACPLSSSPEGCIAPGRGHFLILAIASAGQGRKNLARPKIALALAKISGYLSRQCWTTAKEARSVMWAGLVGILVFSGLLWLVGRASDRRTR
jgi:hypothetical protein